MAMWRMLIWRFPEVGGLQVPGNPLFFVLFGFSILNHPALGVPAFMETPNPRTQAHVHCIQADRGSVSGARTGTSKSNWLHPKYVPPCPNRYHLRALAKSQARASRAWFPALQMVYLKARRTHNRQECDASCRDHVFAAILSGVWLVHMYIYLYKHT